MSFARLTLFPIAVFSARAAVDFKDFRTMSDLSLAGSASAPNRVLRLTPAQKDRSGAVWLKEKQPVAAGFDTTFRFRLSKQGGLGGGADGIAFVLQQTGERALGGMGGAGGFAVRDPSYHRSGGGIPWSFAVFFDTFQNESDPSDNSLSFRTYGRPEEMRWPAERLASSPRLQVRLKDGNTHTARILYRPPMLSVFLDGAPVLEAPVDLSIVMDNRGTAWVGFTASTGSGYKNHDVLSWSFTSEQVSASMSVVSSEITFLMSECLPGRNLCTPERATIEPKDGGYHIILPANLPWGASVPNPSGQPVQIVGEHGVACWDRAARGGCGGPSGSGPPAGSGYLSPDAPAGALILKQSEGRTWVSLNGRAGDEFRGNEGFYEFDLKMAP